MPTATVRRAGQGTAMNALGLPEPVDDPAGVMGRAHPTNRLAAAISLDHSFAASSLRSLVSRVSRELRPFFYPVRCVALRAARPIHH